ncbi:multiple coagulation factor deficiency protein 2 homolog [Panulirus ornatus]|uniref:multiple coagulation factor deficiency protein 2 homolog n=1 Tax=Panulirus ornatus TaxID=150431 RepID=UPI003A863834
MWSVMLVWTASLLVEASGDWSRGPGNKGYPHHMKQQHNDRSSERHRHYVPKRPSDTFPKPKILEDNDLLHDKEHLKEELPNYLSMEKIEAMSERELDYHYFRMHDFDENLRLDGLELLVAIMHVDGNDDEEEEDAKEEEEKFQGLSEEDRKAVHSLRQQTRDENMKFYIELVDEVIAENDLNNDGYLSWAEFLNGRGRRI